MCLKSYYSRQLKKNAKSCPPKKALPLMNMKKWTTFELFVLGLSLGTLGTTMEGTHKLWSLSSWLSWEHGLEGSIRKPFESHVLADTCTRFGIWNWELFWERYLKKDKLWPSWMISLATLHVASSLDGVVPIENQLTT